MTPDAASQSPRRWRFPLTFLALAGSAVALPVYALVAVSDAPATGAQATMAEAEPATEVTADIPHRDAPPKKAALASEPMPVAGSGVLADPAMPARPAAGKPESGKPESSGEGLTAVFDGTLASDDEPVSVGGGRHIVDTEEEGPGFDPQLRARVLTAGRTSDLRSRQSIDALRIAAVNGDFALKLAVPNNDRVGAAPTPGLPPASLEIGLVLDTTGSMGDELAYLKVELRSIAQAVAAEFPGVAQRYALVAYRDHGDAYLLREHDFAPMQEFIEHLGAEQAGGGGDTPEALDLAMAATTQLNWSQSAAAKLVFVVADAPPHQADYTRYVSATQSLANAGISVYPVASSGVETSCEYLMRWAARVTGGEYLFLTDHSGIGNAHADPHVDQYEMKTLYDHMLEVIRLELGATPSQTVTVAVRQPNETVVHHVTQVHVDDGSSWWREHGVIMWMIGGVFLFGFAGDMALAHNAARRR